MTTKYKELPAFETNEFKAGDAVAFYRNCGRAIGEIKDICDDRLEVIYERGNGYNSCTSVHFKQCRKLEEIKPREFYLHLWGSSIFTQEECAERGIATSNLIKVREVIE